MALNSHRPTRPDATRREPVERFVIDRIILYSLHKWPGSERLAAIERPGLTIFQYHENVLTQLVCRQQSGVVVNSVHTARPDSTRQSSLVALRRAVWPGPEVPTSHYFAAVADYDISGLGQR